jgi:hypothetical protein
MRVRFENHDYGSRNGFDNHKITCVYQERVTLFARITCVFCGFERLEFFFVKGVGRECVRELLVI